MQKKAKTILQVLLFLALGLLLIRWRSTAMLPEERSEMAKAFGQIEWLSIIPVFIVGFLAHLFRALRWKQLLSPLQLYPKTSNTVLAVLIGYLANSLVPRLGEVAKCTTLAKYERAPVEKLFGSIIAERAFDTISLLIVMLASILLERDKTQILIQRYFLPIFLDEQGQVKTMPLVVLGIVALLCILLFIILKNKWRNTRIMSLLNNLWAGVLSIFRLRNAWLFLLWSVLIWSMYLLQVYFAFAALPQTADLSLSAALAIMAFGSIGMIATPGGFGAYPIIVGSVLVLFSMNEGVGTAFGWVSWGFQTIVTLVLGLLAVVLLPILNAKSNNG